MYTPPTTQGTILYPFTGGGSNWGGIAFDPGLGVVFLNTSSAIHKVTLIPADKVAAEDKAYPDADDAAQPGVRRYGMKTRAVAAAPLGLPCNPPPWGRAHRGGHA